MMINLKPWLVIHAWAPYWQCLNRFQGDSHGRDSSVVICKQCLQQHFMANCACAAIMWAAEFCAAEGCPNGNSTGCVVNCYSACALMPTCNNTQFAMAYMTCSATCQF